MGPMEVGMSDQAVQDSGKVGIGRMRPSIVRGVCKTQIFIRLRWLGVFSNLSMLVMHISAIRSA